MSESPYTPPKARIDPPPYSGRPVFERPKEVLIAIWLLIAGHLVGWVGVLAAWDYLTLLQAPAQFFWVKHSALPSQPGFITRSIMAEIGRGSCF